MDMAKYIEYLKGIKGYKQQIVHIEEIPAKKARYGKLKKDLPECLQNYLDSKQIKLYSHQSEAINKIREGKNVVIVT
ncbi:MAG: hypothetical protein GX638_17050, partial [Crenarchaeota archaeon]|nr:hypothetical protein [Thermoproteota archaeon]